jgi:hypothetical protein
MKAITAIPKLPVTLGRKLARKATANHRSLEGEILHRLESSIKLDAAEEELATHLRRALSAEQVPMQPDEVLAWANEISSPRARRSRQE